MANTGRVHTARLRNGDNIMKKSKKNNNFKDTSETKSKKEKNYRIIRIDENGKKVTMVRFWAPKIINITFKNFRRNAIYFTNSVIFKF